MGTSRALGGINVVTCRYPADRQWEFRPIANAISYSFSLQAMVVTAGGYVSG